MIDLRGFENVEKKVQQFPLSPVCLAMMIILWQVHRGEHNHKNMCPRTPFQPDVNGTYSK